MLRSIRIALLLAAAGCATAHVSSTAYRQLPPKPTADDVEVYSDGRPDRPYEEIGLIEVNRTGLTGSYGLLIQRARLEAATMGADAIIVTRTPHKYTTTIANEVGRTRRGRRNVVATTTEHVDPRITVSAIVWKQSQEGGDR
jgi:hypothetical protein